ncbi:NAD dependent epimerase/dehydratase family protein-like protein [Lophiostoma macrostomum CBS 122681]|uniref:NAD dependent epimerase/dehydratase family protein-like protein n=1 Tax=Lophiostoma macrostomum CBS 122681 TaxID=1314788 RepID=A0A6A6T304_9PLEO|nr:NAD dependent epimerase/dehydratase family protein-like protein [Lophiostoma macrostomum CBS 122681]
MTTVALAGSTGLVGSHILTTLLADPTISTIHTYARRAPPNPTSSPKLVHISNADSSTWPSTFPTFPPPQIFISALGTTRSAAGSIPAQRAIDLDLNLSLARAARAAGVSCYVLVSSSGANARSGMAYAKMKGELEERVSELGFEYTVILRPGLILGDRVEARPAEAVARRVAGWLGSVSPRLTGGWCNGAEGIARAAVRAGGLCVGGEREGGEGKGKGKGVWVLGIAEIAELGKE